MGFLKLDEKAVVKMAAFSESVLTILPRWEREGIPEVHLNLLVMRERAAKL